MTGFLGEYRATVDNKGRLRIPAGVKKQLSPDANGRFVINRGFEDCLVIYPMNEWELITKKLSALNRFRKEDREFMRNFLRGATILELDDQDRINIPNHLLAFADIQGEMVISSQQDIIELWSVKKYEEQMKVDSDRYADLAEKVLGNRKEENL